MCVRLDSWGVVVHLVQVRWGGGLHTPDCENGGRVGPVQRRVADLDANWAVCVGIFRQFGALPKHVWGGAALIVDILLVALGGTACMRSYTLSAHDFRASTSVSCNLWTAAFANEGRLACFCCKEWGERPDTKRGGHKRQPVHVMLFAMPRYQKHTLVPQARL